MREDILVLVSSYGHDSRAYLAEAYSMSPSGSVECYLVSVFLYDEG